ncbi:hypothetical protein TNIN_186171 [Trichonephila inaurata madagascariensis]|uniref:Uncharacterized protein n=1 Tax=Trichonephila inaurata madagascariensis TaxID=2747483 RepID=A0A8X6Y8B1_9ARAC|nr:hypothetical protein TNIN_186171 [Trichonephila inaurata madagascariensis]
MFFCSRNRYELKVKSYGCDSINMFKKDFFLLYHLFLKNHLMVPNNHPKSAGLASSIFTFRNTERRHLVVFFGSPWVRRGLSKPFQKEKRTDGLYK